MGEKLLSNIINARESRDDKGNISLYKINYSLRKYKFSLKFSKIKCIYIFIILASSIDHSLNKI